MQAAQNIALLLVQTLGGLYVFLAVLRVLLRASRADFYNPGSQLVVKATQLPVSLLSKVIPSWKRLDIAGVIWVLLAHIIVIELSALSVGGFVPATIAISWAVIGSLNFLLTIVWWGLLILIIVSFATLITGNMIRHPLLDLIQQLMAPIMYPIQKLLPPFSGIDLSPIILFLAIRVFQEITYHMAHSAHINPNFVVGF